MTLGISCKGIAPVSVTYPSLLTYRQWAGYDSDADRYFSLHILTIDGTSAKVGVNSWEPAENVKQCDRLLGSFWRHVGTDDDDYPIGYEVSARKEWIGS